MNTGKVTIYGKSTLGKPLLDSEEVCTIVIRDEEGIPCVLLKRLFGNTWITSKSGDSDWKQVLARFGIK